MEAIVGEDIVIRDYTQEVFDFFSSKLTFTNPEYMKKLNSGRWMGDTPEKISLIQRHGRDLVIPFGMLPEVFNKRKAFSGIYNSFNFKLGSFDYKSSIKPYDYQEEAIKKALEDRHGVIVAPCGAGKTQIGLEIAARLGGRTLWLTHTTDLLNQSMERAKAHFGLNKEDYGTITAGKINIGEVITFATVQTMNKIDLANLKDKWDVIIVDECHHVVGTPTKVMMFYHVTSSLKARYKYGLTATPKRSDGLTPCMFALIGPKVCEINRDAVESTTCQVKVKIRKTFYMPDMDRILMPDGTISYPRFINDVISNKERNEMIVDDIVNAEGTCLVLTDRIQHIEIIRKKLDERGVKSLALMAAGTKKAKEERENAIYALTNRCVKVLVATYALAKEGLDVPSLDNLFMITPQKNETVVTQSAGRVARKAEGKQFGSIYDYEDSFSMLMSWQRKRNSMYKKLGFEIVEE
jgi:superfamily II DNA or RNA helicase